MRTKVILAIAVIALMFGAVLTWKVNAIGNKIFGGTHVSFFKQILVLVTNKNSKVLAGEDRGRTNIMIYGLTADQNRTDTIILASYYWSEHKLVMLNIPRDLYATYDGRSTKIVSLYAIAKSQKPGDRTYPAEYVSDFISREYGIPIDYWVVANFNGFKKIVDAVNGITVNVPNSFIDYEYPTDEYNGYMRPAPHFDAGVQTMDGARALIYARSRHARGAEGSDFARSRRQQQIIQAVVEKIKAQGRLADISKINTYLDIAGDNISTNLAVSELARAAAIANQSEPAQDIITANWNTSIGFLCDASSQDGVYILLYGVVEDCVAKAGVNNGSLYRQRAIDYVQNLLQSAQTRADKPGKNTLTPH